MHVTPHEQICRGRSLPQIGEEIHPTVEPDGGAPGSDHCTRPHVAISTGRQAGFDSVGDR